MVILNSLYYRQSADNNPDDAINDYESGMLIAKNRLDSLNRADPQQNNAESVVNDLAYVGGFGVSKSSCK